MTSFDFSFFSFYFLVVQKVEFSHPVQYSASPKYPCFPDLLYSSYIVCMADGRTLSLLRLECSREEECLIRAKNFSARNPQLFSLSSLLTEVPKNRSHPRLIQEYFFLSLLLIPMMRVNPIELFFYGQFRLLLIEQKSLRQSRLPDGIICMKRCRRFGNSGEKV